MIRPAVAPLALALLVAACAGAPAPAPPPAAEPALDLRGPCRAIAAAQRRDPRVAALLPGDWPAADPRFVDAAGPRAELAPVRALCAQLPDHAFDGTVADCAGLAAAEAALRPGNRRSLARVEVAAHRVVLELVAAFGGDARLAFAALAATPADAVVRAHWPQGDQYGRLVEAHARYRAAVEAGGWPAIPPGVVAAGEQGPVVAALRARLAAEGFGAGEGDRFDGALVEALLRFQAAHGVAGVARLDAPTRDALAVPPGVVLDAVRQALRAWRAAPRRPAYRVEINVDDFHGEVWRDGARALRFRVVVGRPGQNATPVLASGIRHVVVNPYWNVPPRIYAEELRPPDHDRMSRDELAAALAAKGFQLMAPERAEPWVRQPPGPTNPLGRLKFLFPNPYDVYLHDSPAKALFDEAHRAYSHGCVRVERPIELARTLLRHDGAGDPEDLDAWLDDDAEQVVTLLEPVPVFIDARPLRVDDHGAVQALPDLYGRGWAFAAPRDAAR